MESDAVAAKDIRLDPCIQGLLDRMPAGVGQTLSEEQLLCLKNALGAHRGGRHQVDLRGSFSFLRRRYYYVVLFGRERRQLTRRELRTAKSAKAVFLAALLLFSLLTGLLLLYLSKSVLGLDLLPQHSLDLWGWFKAHTLS